MKPIWEYLPILDITTIQRSQYKEITIRGQYKVERMSFSKMKKTSSISIHNEHEAYKQIAQEITLKLLAMSGFSNLSEIDFAEHTPLAYDSTYMTIMFMAREVVTNDNLEEKIIIKPIYEKNN